MRMVYTVYAYTKSAYSLDIVGLSGFKYVSSTVKSLQSLQMGGCANLTFPDGFETTNQI